MSEPTHQNCKVCKLLLPVHKFDHPAPMPGVYAGARKSVCRRCELLAWEKNNLKKMHAFN